MNAELLESLNLFGLSDYEAKAYAALASIGTGSVTEVSQVCDVPRSNLYAVLERLAQKGWAEVQQGRPVLFKAVAPAKVFAEVEKEQSEKLKKAKEKAVKQLEELSGKKTTEAVPALIWGVRGYGSVLSKICEIIKRSRKELLINIPDMSVLSPEIIKELEKAKERGAKIKIATENKGDLSRFHKIALIRVRDKIHGIDVVGDEREVLVAPGIPIVAAWLDNPEMALHVKDFLELVWKDAKVLK